MDSNAHNHEWLRYSNWLNKISVEPTLWLYMMAFMITSVIEQAFFSYKACRVDHGYSEEICSNLPHYTEMKTRVQMTVSEFHQWNSIASHIVPIFLAIFIGNWSDYYGRKLPLIIGLTGKLIYSFMIIINSAMENWSLNMIIYSASLPMGILGGDVLIFASCFAYISDISSAKERTLRVTLLDVIYLSTMPTGVAIGSFLFNNVTNSSYTILFTVNTFLMIAAIVYSLRYLQWQTTSNQVSISWTRSLFNFFDKQHASETLRTLIKKRAYNGRVYLWIILLCMILYTFQRDEKPLSYLYTQLKFDWGIEEYSYFRTFNSTLFVIAMLITVPIMNRFLLLSDTIVIIMGALSHAAGRIFFATAEVWQVFYFGGIVAALGPIAAPALRSIASKIVPVEERGKVFCILSVCDNAVPLISSVMYSQLYNVSISTAPSSIFWLTFSSQLAIVTLMWSIHSSTSLTQLVDG